MTVKRIFTDQMGRKVEVSFPPQRIVSLVPSQTELLYDLGLTGEVVGQTLFCIHPQHQHKAKPRVGGTKNFKLQAIAALKPDLIIGNKEENDQARIEELARHYPVWMSDIQTLDHSLEMMQQVGALVNKEAEAQKLVESIQKSFEDVTLGLSLPADLDNKRQDDSVNSFDSLTGKQPALNHKLKTAYFIWRKPWMVAGHDTFIDDMLNRLGLENIFANEQSRYPEITEEKLAGADPGLLLLSSEPYPFKQEHLDELQVLCPKAKIILVDGELFSWYGSRLIHSVPYFKQLYTLIHTP
jgi:ABC-type Fe3+-hydroxamate transport system substrate-binding protein